MFYDLSCTVTVILPAVRSSLASRISKGIMPHELLTWLKLIAQDSGLSSPDSSPVMARALRCVLGQDTYFYNYLKLCLSGKFTAGGNPAMKLIIFLKFSQYKETF